MGKLKLSKEVKELPVFYFWLKDGDGQGRRLRLF